VNIFLASFSLAVYAYARRNESEQANSLIAKLQVVNVMADQMTSKMGLFGDIMTADCIRLTIKQQKEALQTKLNRSHSQERSRTI